MRLRIINPSMIESRRFALVAYVQGDLIQFVDDLRRELHPALPPLPAHLTILPPRCLLGSEQAARDILEETCSQVQPFEVTLGEVETFIPITPTLFIRVSNAAYRMRELHDALSRDELAGIEQWPYMPHMTIAKMATEVQAQTALTKAQKRWAEFPGSHTVRVKDLTFVREDSPNCWADISAVTLGGSLVKG